MTDLSFADALGQAADPVLITDADMDAPGPRILYANAAFERLSGYTVDELVGRSPRLLQGPQTSRAVLDELRGRLAAGRPFVGTTVNYRKDGTPFNIEWHISPVQGPDGRVAQFLSIHRDVTAQATFDRGIGHYVNDLLAQLAAHEARHRELLDTNVRLRAQATTDGLTGLHNHRHFHETLPKTLAAEPVTSLLMIDVDHFKSFNDTFGHPAGDAVLQGIANVLRSCLRERDTIARYGGEEFAVVLPGLDEDHALSVAERVRTTIEAAPNPHRSATVSIGIATTRDGAGADRILVDQADSALYAAKAQGRNRVRHQRHLQLRTVAVPQAGAACAPSPSGCLKCESVPGNAQGCGPAAALVLAPQDADAAATLRAALAGTDFAVGEIGPVVVVRDVRKRLAELGTVLKEQLSPYTRSCIRAAYAPAGADTAEQALGAFVFAEPLSKMVDHVEHAWVRDALNENWLFSVFHPILDARTGQTFAMEALLRGRDPTDNRILGAGQIIKACEVLNLTHQLDQRARQAGIRAAAQHVPQPARIFINFLPNTIYDPEICLRTTMAAADEAGVAMSRLVFEVVETEDIPDMARLRHILDFYRARGVGTAVDDMGAGFTSIEYVKALQPDYVKLDRDVVVDAAAKGGDEQRELVELVRASHGFGAKVIAEGIETEQQMAVCVDAGVDLLQGFLFAKPASPPQAVAWPAARRLAA